MRSVGAGRFPGDEKSRLGVTVSKREGISVIRNRIKRRVRETYRLMLRAMLMPGVSLLVIARAGAGERSGPHCARLRRHRRRELRSPRRSEYGKWPVRA